MALPNPRRKRRYPFKRQLKRKLRKIALMVIVAVIATGINYYNNNVKLYDVDTPSDLIPSVKPGLEKEIKESIKRIQASSDAINSRFWVTVRGDVIKLLNDDRKGTKHQKFLIAISPDTTLLISHNIDLAPRVPVQKGDQITLRGLYEWNNRGGLIHWTHHDPKGRKKGGWIQLYQKEYK